MNKMRRGISLAPLLVLLGLVVAVPASVYLVKHEQSKQVQAANNAAHFSFTTDGQILPPNRNVHVMLDVQSEQVGFVSAIIQFDPTKVQLASEVTTTQLLKTVVQKTSMATANTNGKITVVLGLSPDDRANPPTGMFEIASFQVISNTAESNATSIFSIDLTGSQVANMTSQSLVADVVPLTFLINQVIPTNTVAPVITNTPVPTNTTMPTSTPLPTSTPRPTNTPVPTSTPRPTNTPIPTSTPTLVPTSTPRPTNTPVPTAIPTIAPTATIPVLPTTIPVITSGLFAGNSAVGSLLDSLDSNYMNGLLVKTGTESMQVLSARVAVANIAASPNNKFSMAIFSDQNGKPGSLIASSPVQTLNPSVEWQSVAMSAVLSANTKYWLMYNSNGVLASDNVLKYSVGTVGQGAYSILQQPFGQGWPSSFGSSVVYSNNFSMYLSSDAVVNPGPAAPTATPAPISGSGVTFGNLAVGTLTDTSNSSYINGSLFTNPSAGTTKSISVYVGDVDPSQANRNYQLAIYTNSFTGKPASLVAVTQIGTLTANSWNSLPINTNLAANTKYWLLYNTNGQSPAVNDMKYSSTGVGVYSANKVQFGSFASSLSNLSVVKNKNNYSLFVTMAGR